MSNQQEKAKEIAKEEIAQNLLTKGYSISIEEIAEVTNLTEERVLKLKQGLR